MQPTLDYFLPYQVRWIEEEAAVAIGQKSRRIGFTHAQAYRAVERRVKQLGDYWHSSADMTASVEFIEECSAWAKIFNVGAKVVEAEEVVDEQTISTMQLRFNSGAKIVAGSSNPKFFRSKGGEAGLDEFAFHAQGRELFKAAHATALFWDYPLRIWSTHNGEGSYFNSLVKLAQQPDGKFKAAVHTVTILDAVEQGIVEKIKNLKTRDDRARQEWLDELHATCPDEDTWNEEYMCTPSSDQASLLTYELIRGCEAPDLKLVQSPEELDSNGVYYAGYDVGRRRDLSVLWVLQKLGDVFVTRMVRELDQVNFTAQEGLLNVLMANRQVKRLCGDATGMGEMLFERAHGKWGGRVEPVHFTAPVKSELAMPLLRLFQDKLVRVPAVDAVREDLHKIRKIVTAAHNVRLDADRDELGHGDRFWALALAYHAADDVRLPLPAPLEAKPVGW